MSKHKIYPFAVAVVRSKENNLVTKDKLMQMAEAPTAQDALRILTESGYGSLPADEVHDFEKLLSAQLRTLTGLWRGSYRMISWSMFFFIKTTITI